MLLMEDIKPLCSDDSIILTNHVLEKMKERDIKYENITAVILNGEIIAQYEDDKPFPSCLILGYTMERKPLHTVVSTNEGSLWVITAYFPTLDIWEDDYKTRRAAK